MHPVTSCFPLATILLFYETIFISTTVSKNKLKFGIRLCYTKGRFKQIKSFCGYLNISVIKIWKHVSEIIAPTFLSAIRLPSQNGNNTVDTLFNKIELQMAQILMMNDLKITVSVMYIHQRSFWSKSHPFSPQNI